MIVVNNKTAIEKCIISFSHNKYSARKEADALSLSKAEREIATGKNGISHLILRADDDDIDRLKFLFLIRGVPIMCYALGNLLNSSLREIVVVGSEEVKKVMDRFLDIVGTCGKTVQFVLEDAQHLNLVNTMNLGRELLSPARDELVLFQPGDLPFLYDLEKVLHWPDNKKYNMVLWLNSRQQMFPEFEKNPASEFVKRNYHYRTLSDHEDGLLDLKEPNLYPINFAMMDSDIIDQLHSSRKDGQIIHAGIQTALQKPLRLLKVFPYFIEHLLTFQPKVNRLRSGDQYQFGMSRKIFHKGASHLLNTPMTTTVHDDPAFVSDIDALEDWEDFESLTHYAEKIHGPEGLEIIHPFGKSLTRFREEGMPELQTEIPMYRDFPSYLNSIYETLKMGHVPFDKDKQYTSPNAGLKEVELAYHWYKQKCELLKQNTAPENLQRA
ncbi:MAG: hypothetical protein H8E42_06490 [Nitrospinae bacterium]|nr:hypothetical protein [Nitrospinota bacterium]MBL7019476.1 hypothetical protein [Nitrospinaceae bacterium]